jgi:hypothetical protein
MRATILFRITAVVFLLFAAGHTVGFLSFKPATEQALAVRDAMNNVHFEANGKIFSYGGWYRGFGLTATFAMLFEAFLAWRLGSMAKRGSPDVKALGWAFFLWQLPGLVLAYIYFGVIPTIFSLVATALVAAATWSAKTQPD